MNAVIEFAARYRLAPGAAIRPERFGGLVYRHDQRRLYFLRSHQTVDFVAHLDGRRSLGENLEAFLMARALPGSARGTLIEAVARLTRLGILIRLT